jgi:exodeoxyribonuclease-3
VSSPLLPRLKWSEIDREARKGKPIPSDHAPVVIDLDELGRPFEAGWTAAASRIAQRRVPKQPT